MARPTMTAKIELPAGVAPRQVSCRLRLVASTTSDAFGYAPGTAGRITVGGVRTFSPDSSGTISLPNMRPNSGVSSDVISTPTGTVYELTTKFPSGRAYVETFTVPDAAGTYQIADYLSPVPGSLAAGSVPSSGGTMTGALVLPAGSAVAPALGLGGSTTGLYYDAGNVAVGIAVGGTARATVSASSLLGPAMHAATFDTTTGVYWPGSSVLQLWTGGAARWQIDAAGVLSPAAAGSVAPPSRTSAAGYALAIAGGATDGVGPSAGGALTLTGGAAGAVTGAAGGPVTITGGAAAGFATGGAVNITGGSSGGTGGGVVIRAGGGLGSGTVTIGDATTAAVSLGASGVNVNVANHASGKVGFFATAAATKQTVTGAKGGNAALASLLTALAAYGLVTDSTT